MSDTKKHKVRARLKRNLETKSFFQATGCKKYAIVYDAIEDYIHNRTRKIKLSDDSANSQIEELSRLEKPLIRIKEITNKIVWKKTKKLRF